MNNILNMNINEWIDYKPSLITYEIYRLSKNKFEINYTSNGWYIVVVSKKTMKDILENKQDMTTLNWE